MSLGEELNARVQEIFSQQWKLRTGTVVPEAEDLPLANVAVELDPATVLYSDLSGSTQLVTTKKWTFAAEIYKSFLFCAARVIGAEGGTVTAYDGDRVMAVFIGEAPNTSAAHAALKINYCAKKIVNPLLKKQYADSTYEVRHVTGIDTSTLRATRTGVRGANDLVWVGRAANYAAKLTELAGDDASWVTADVYKKLNDSATTSKGTAMWRARTWTQMNNLRVYSSNWTWRVD
jgi:class 3 adenylate cyclase